MSTNVVLNSEARKKVLAGMAAVFNSVSVTMGARGRNVVIKKLNWPQKSTKDGVSVAKEIELEDPIENTGATMIKEAAIKTAETSGDGTTTATVLTYAIVSGAIKAIESGVSSIDIKSGIEKYTAAVVEEIKKLSKEVNDNNLVKQIATVSANNDLEIGTLIAQAFEKVGRDGLIKVQESNSHKTSIDILQGIKFDNGYLSPFFVTNAENQSVELKNPYILLYDETIVKMKDLLHIMDGVITEGRSLLLVVDDLEGEALASVVYNCVKGVIKVCAVKAPSFSDNRIGIMEDLAILTGGTLISEKKGMKLEQSQLNLLGQSDKVIVDRSGTTIIGGKGDAPTIQARINLLKTMLENATHQYEKDALSSRIASLKDGIAVINIGGITTTEIKEKSDRVDDALCATKSAAQEGYVAGGGVTYLRIANDLKINADSEDEKVGINIIKKALEAPFRQILSNGGIDEASSYIKELASYEYGMGFNIKTKKVDNLFDVGVIDPAKVLRCALENAVSVALLAITTESIISENKPQQNAR